MKKSHIAIGLAVIGLGLLVWLIFLRSGPGDEASATNAVANGSKMTEAELIAANREPPPAAPAPAPASTEPPALTAAWLRGAWRPAADHNTRDPNAPCETDVVVIFHADGRYEHGDGSSGRYRASGDQEVTFYDHVIREMGSDEEDRSEFDQQRRQRIVPVDQNSMRAEGEEMVRCRVG